VATPFKPINELTDPAQIEIVRGYRSKSATFCRVLRITRCQRILAAQVLSSSPTDNQRKLTPGTHGSPLQTPAGGETGYYLTHLST
jgi:hypothetical protein